MARERKEFYIRISRADHLRRLQAIHPRHRNIHYDYVRPKFFRLGKREFAVVGFTNDLHIGLGVYKQFDALSNGFVVLSKEDAKLAFHRSTLKRHTNKNRGAFSGG